MVGLSPYPYASFAALRRTFGALFVQCTRCRRYVRLVVRPIRERDSRTTTFSCCLCGSEGQLVLDDPGDKGFFLDERPNPPRHPSARDRILRGNPPVREPPRSLIDPPKRGP